jgi:glutamate N-acetyltransferase/amino-acid N-acetyltransferase
MKQVHGGVCAPQGFTASGVAAAIKLSSKKRDCALIASDRIAEVAGMFTQNILKSPPVIWNQSVCLREAARAVFLNSGNANAATGKRGMDDVRTTAQQVGKKLGIEPDQVCILSTGVIGVPLPMDRIQKGIEGCAGSLSREGSLLAAEAIMTTDRTPKQMSIEITIGGRPVRIGAIAKGAGMISPNMATLLCILTTDAAFAPEVLHSLLFDAVDQSFNRIGIDNDMSTSDTVLILANGASGAPAIGARSKERDVFGEALTQLCKDLAHWIIKDGEGVTKLVEIFVRGAQSDDDAKTVARSIGNSMLCKTAFFGQDPNWGRVACAAGYAGVEFDPAELDIWLGNVQVCKGGLGAGHAEADAADVMRQPEFTITVNLGDGPGDAIFWTSDLSHDYVSINADYRT